MQLTENGALSRRVSKQNAVRAVLINISLLSSSYRIALDQLRSSCRVPSFENSNHEIWPP
jgi:hypothetical protein